MQSIALLTTSYPDDTPGAEAAGSFVAEFAKELSARVRVVVVAAGLSDSITTEQDLTVKRFAVPRLPLSLLSASNPRDWGAIASTLRAGKRALAEAVETERIDHIFALWVLPSGWWARSVGARRNIAYSTWALGSDIWSLGRVPFVRQMLSRVLRDASFRYADGLQLCSDVEAIGGSPCAFLPSSRKLDLVRNEGVAEKPPYKLAFLGRWHPNKGADLLMQALGLLGDDDWARINELRYFGGGPLDTEIRAAADKLHRADRPVTIGGYLDKHAAAELISWADYLLLPSRVESVPVVFSDAMQLGTPVISTPVGDLPHLIDNYGAGVLARDASAKAYCEAIREGLGGNASRYCGRLRAAARDFDLGRTTERLLHDIESIGQ